MLLEIGFISFGLYESFYTITLLLDYWPRRSSALYRWAVLTALLQFAVIGLDFYVIGPILNARGDPKLVSSPPVAATNFIGVVTQCLVLMIGLLRYRRVYENRMSRALYIVVIIAIVLNFLAGLSLVFLLFVNFSIFAIANAITGMTGIFCAIMDVLLSITFLRALMTGLNLGDSYFTRFMGSSNAKRLLFMAVLCGFLGVMKLVVGILSSINQTTIDFVNQELIWVHVIPAWAMTYSLNTFLLISYETTRKILQDSNKSNSLSVNIRRAKEAESADHADEFHRVLPGPTNSTKTTDDTVFDARSHQRHY